MIRDSISKILAEMSLVTFIKECRAQGRRDANSAMRKEFSDAYLDLRALLESSAQLDPNEYATLRFSVAFCDSEKFIVVGQEPTYEIYTNLAVLDMYIGVQSRWSITRTFNRCRQALALLVDDWSEYERTSFEDHFKGVPPRTGYDQDSVVERIFLLRELYKSIPTNDVPRIPPLGSVPSGYSSDWEYFASSEHGAVAFVHATCLPQTNWHDEYLFIRTLHCMEVCFWALITAIRGAGQYCAAGSWRDATACLKEGNTFASLLVPLFNVFKTMPFASFKDGFRDKTGNSSAIQSAKYQILDLLVRGFSARKLETIKKIHQDHPFANWVPPPHLTLAGIHKGCLFAEPADRLALQAECEEMDQHLRSWRGDHLGIVRYYLGIDTTGTGGEGYDYLYDTYKDPPGLAGARAAPAPAQGLDTGPSVEWYVKSNLTAEEEFPDFALLRAFAPRKSAFLGQMQAKRAEWLREMLANGSPIAERFKYYDPISAEFGNINRLEMMSPQSADALFDTNIVEYLAQSLTLRTGLMVSLVSLSAIKLPLRFVRAADGTTFKPRKGPELRLRDNEIFLADAKGPIFSYAHGPTLRVVVPDPRAKPEVERWADILCIVASAPEMPDPIFRGALAAVAETLVGFSSQVEQATLKEA